MPHDNGPHDSAGKFFQNLFRLFGSGNRTPTQTTPDGTEGGSRRTFRDLPYEEQRRERRIPILGQTPGQIARPGSKSFGIKGLEEFPTTAEIIGGFDPNAMLPNYLRQFGAATSTPTTTDTSKTEKDLSESLFSMDERQLELQEKQFALNEEIARAQIETDRYIAEGNWAEAAKSRRLQEELNASQLEFAREELQLERQKAQVQTQLSTIQLIQSIVSDPATLAAFQKLGIELPGADLLSEFERDGASSRPQAPLGEDILSAVPQALPPTTAELQAQGAQQAAVQAQFASAPDTISIEAGGEEGINQAKFNQLLEEFEAKTGRAPTREERVTLEGMARLENTGDLEETFLNLTGSTGGDSDKPFGGPSSPVPGLVGPDYQQRVLDAYNAENDRRATGQKPLLTDEQFALLQQEAVVSKDEKKESLIDTFNEALAKAKKTSVKQKPLSAQALAKLSPAELVDYGLNAAFAGQDPQELLEIARKALPRRGVSVRRG